MKSKIQKIHWWLGITAVVGGLLFLDLAGGFTIIGYYWNDRQQKGLSFSFQSCDTTNEDSASVVLKEWRGDTLVVRGTAFPNCAATWLFGSYEVAGNKLLLKYSPVQGPLFAGCGCPKEVRYEIQSLRFADYDVSISEGDVIWYMPLVARFLLPQYKPLK